MISGALIVSAVREAGDDFPADVRRKDLTDLILNTAPGASECQTLDISDAATELGVQRDCPTASPPQGIRKLPGLRRILISRTEIHRFLNKH
jgi:hypothetical protein